MNSHSTFIAATLGLPTSWTVQDAYISGEKILNIRVIPTPGSNFICPLCGSPATIFTSESDELWEHDSFLDRQARISARVPNIDCQSGCGLQRIIPPWQHPNSKFRRLPDTP